MSDWTNRNFEDVEGKREEMERFGDVNDLVDDFSPLSISRIPDLPTEVIGIVAKILQSQCLFRTCVNLNETCRAVFEETQPALWKIVILCYHSRDRDSKYKQLKESKGAQYIEFFAAVNVNWKLNEALQNAHLGGASYHMMDDLPRLKAYLRVDQDPDRADVFLDTTVFANLTDNYEFNTIDSVNLGTTLDLLCSAPELASPCQDATRYRRLYIMPPNPSIRSSAQPFNRSLSFPYREASSLVDRIVYEHISAPGDSWISLESLITDYASLLGRSPLTEDPTEPFSSQFSLIVSDVSTLRKAIDGLDSAMLKNTDLATIRFSIDLAELVSLKQMMRATLPLITTLNRISLLVKQTLSITINVGMYEMHMSQHSYPNGVARLSVAGTNRAFEIDYKFDQDGNMIRGTGATRHGEDEPALI